MKRVSYKLKIITLLVILGSFFSTLVQPSFAKEDKDLHSLYGDLFVPVFDIKLTEGNGTFDSVKEREDRKELNKRIAENTQTEKVSLFDRFGPNISFIPYYGERNFSLNVVDNLYSKVVEDSDDFEFGISDLFFKSSSYFNTEVYYGRPYVLQDSEIKNNFTDPRTSQYGNRMGTGGAASLGNFYLSIAKFLVDFSTWFISGKMFNIIFSLANTLFESPAWKFFSDTVKIILPLVMIFVIIRLASQAIKVAKGDINHSKEGFIRLIVGTFLALGIIFVFIAAPGKLNSVIEKGITGLDNLMAQAISESVNDEVISSSNPDNVFKAMVWKTAILEPWCNGMFQDDYEHLYTQLDPDANHVKMAQSHQEKDDNKSTRNSAKLTGDVQVKIGGNTVVRNWCALAWSTQSIYHLNADGYEMNIENGWPAALHTANDKNVYVDTFRWIDAKLNVSPLYKGKTEVLNDYKESNSYKETFIIEGMNALILAILSLFLLPLAFKRMISLVMIVGITVQWILISLKNLITMNSFDNNIFGSLKNSFKYIKNYAYYSILMFLLLNIYSALVGKGFIQNVAFIIFAITLSSAKVPTTDTFENMKHWAKEKFDSAHAKTKEKFNRFDEKTKRLEGEYRKSAKRKMGDIAEKARSGLNKK